MIRTIKVSYELHSPSNPFEMFGVEILGPYLGAPILIGTGLTGLL